MYSTMYMYSTCIMYSTMYMYTYTSTVCILAIVPITGDGGSR